MPTTGDGQNSDRISSVANAAEARRHLASVDIEPLPDHLQLIDMAIAAQSRGDLFRVCATGGDHYRRADVVGVDVPNALELRRKIAAPEVRTRVKRNRLRRDALLLDRRD